MNLSDITCLVVDNGLFLPLARRLGREYGRVLYYTPNEQAFPTLNRPIIGDGFPEVERCNDPLAVLGEVDLAVFPDIGMASWQEHFESLGIPVWGSHRGDELELNRELFLHTLKDMGLDTPKWHGVRGVTALRDYLKDNTNKYVKVSKYRGVLETFHWRDWEQDEVRLDKLAIKLGPAKELLPFLVLDPIEADAEVGYDGVCVDGQWPSLAVYGIEAKDKGYIGTVQKYADLPEPILRVNEEFGPLLGSYRYRNFFSSEIRVQGDRAFFVDPCCRMPSPSSEVQLELWRNLPEVIWAGAHGELVNPIPAAQFGVEAVLTMKGDKTDWRVFTPPDELRRWLKCGGSCEIDGRLCFPPDDTSGDEVGWLVAIGDDLEETIDTLNERAAMLPDSVDCHTEALVDVLNDFQEAQKQGMDFGSEIPEPEVAVAK